MVTLGQYCGIKARQHTTPANASIAVATGYNSSASAVNAIFFRTYSFPSLFPPSSNSNSISTSPSPSFSKTNSPQSHKYLLNLHPKSLLPRPLHPKHPIHNHNQRRLQLWAPTTHHPSLTPLHQRTPIQFPNRSGYSYCCRFARYTSFISRCGFQASYWTFEGCGWCLGWCFEGF